MKQLLDWYVAAGVDETISDTAVDRFALKAAEAAARAAQVQAEPARPARPQRAGDALKVRDDRGPLVRPTAQPQVSDAAALKSAREIATACESVSALHAALETFDGCPLKKSATNLCFTDGNPAANILLVGEGPGAEEDRKGLPFVGASGQLLDRMLASIELDRTKVLISNTVFWRPPGNRTPTPQEQAVCLPFVERLIQVVSPKLIICVGGPSAKLLLHQTLGITKLRGRWYDYTQDGLDQTIPATALFHPAFLLRSPAMKRQAWADLLAIKAKIQDVA